MFKIILLSGAAGIIGTALGGAVGVFFGRGSGRPISLLLSFSGGIMTSIVCFDLVPKALGLTDIAAATLGICAGIVAIILLEDIVENLTKKANGAYFAAASSALKRAGVIMFFAIALHNLPEGMAIGSGGMHDISLGAVLALTIALHDVPEGMSIALPLVAGGSKKSRAVIWAALSGVPTLLGGIIGCLLGSISERVIGACLALAGGAMLYVTYCEIIPGSLELYRGRSIALCAALGFIFGFLIVNLL